MEYVIIGNSAAAIGAVEGIRKLDKKGQITVISDEPYHTYSRPLISYYLSEKISEDKMLYRDINFYKRNEVTTILGKKAIGLDTQKRVVSLESGVKVNYDKALIATGGKPFIPNIKGLSMAGIFNFVKLDDVIAINKVAAEGSNAVIVGAGLIGLKAAEALTRKGVNVQVVELSNRVLSAILDNEAAGMVQKHLEDQGIKFHLNTTAREVVGNDKADGVILENGQRLECDFLIVAIGIVPNTDLVKDCSISINRGILISNKMQTSVSGIYAAGDVSEGYDMILDTQRVIPILPNAYKQGEIAGLNMAGGNYVYDGGLAMNAIEFFDLPMLTAGIIKAAGEESESIVLCDPDKSIYKKIILRNDQIVGFIFLNEIDRAGIYTKFMSDKENVAQLKGLFFKEGLGYAHFAEKLIDNKVLRGDKVNECDFV